MKIDELKNDKSSYHAKFTIADKDIVELVSKELSTIAKTAKMDGFRVGKVPTSILKKKYADSIRIEIVGKKIQATINETITKNKLDVAFDPKVEDLINKENEDLKFTLKFELLPEITLPDFKKISIEKPVLEVSKKDVDAKLKELSGLLITYDKESKKAAEKDDQLTIDTIGFSEGKEFEGGKLAGHKLVLGSNSFISGFEDQLIGCKTGDDVTVKVTFPTEYHAKDLAGKPAEFKVKVVAIHRGEKSTIDDEFAKKLKYDNVEKLREGIEKNLKLGFETPINTMMKMKLFDRLENILEFDVPQELLDQEEKILEKQIETETQPDATDKNTAKKEDKTDLTKIALRRVRVGLMLAEYIKKHDVKLLESDIQQEIFKQARKYPGQEAQIVEFYRNNAKAVESLQGQVIEEKAVNQIFASDITIKEKTYSQDSLTRLIKKELED